MLLSIPLRLSIRVASSVQVDRERLRFPGGLGGLKVGLTDVQDRGCSKAEVPSEDL